MRHCAVLVPYRRVLVQLEALRFDQLQHDRVMSEFRSQHNRSGAISVDSTTQSGDPTNEIAKVRNTVGDSDQYCSSKQFTQCSRN